ncbi:MAG: homoserine kinase [Cyclobacteriaceae bacterium]|nr:homoserine kinase [Cyclobacteriaceae bacterium]
MKKTNIKVFAPATVANVGCGFDIMGFALKEIGDEITLSLRSDKKLNIRSISGADIPTDPEKNVATVALKKMLDEINESIGFDIDIVKKVHPGSGLGSSASSSAGVVVAANKLLGSPCSTTELISYAMEGEKLVSSKPHADNVGPAILGGFVIIRGYHPLDVISIDYPEDLHVTIAHPQIEIKTAEAKKMLKDRIPLDDAITQWGNVAGLVTGLITKDLDLIGRSLQDVIIEPVRSILIPLYNESKAAALNAGALGYNISGSGPSMFAFSKNLASAQKIQKAIERIYAQANIPVQYHLSQINKQGVIEIH